MMRTNGRPNAKTERERETEKNMENGSSLAWAPVALCTDACRSLALLQGISYINRMLEVFFGIRNFSNSYENISINSITILINWKFGRTQAIQPNSIVVQMEGNCVRSGMR